MSNQNTSSASAQGIEPPARPPTEGSASASPEPRNPVRRLTVAYVAALGLIALVALVSRALVDRTVVAYADDLAAVELLGQQRTLGEQLPKIALAIASTSDQTQRQASALELRAAMDKWLQVQGDLQRRATDLRIVGNDQGETIDVMAQLAPHHEATAAAANALVAAVQSADGSEGAATDVQPFVDAILQHEAAYAPALGRLAQAFRDHARQKLNEHLTTNRMVTAVLLSVVLLSGLMLLYPVTKAAGRQFDRLRQSREHLRSVMANAPIVLWSVDADEVFTLSEGRGLAGLGLKPGEVVGKRVHEVYEDVPPILALVRRALDGQERRTVVEVAGLAFDCWFHPLRDDAGMVTGVLGVATDVTDERRARQALQRAHDELETRVAERTAELLEANQRLQKEVQERRGAEEALRQSERRFRQIAENIREVFWVTDVEKKHILYVSPAFEEVWGQPRQVFYDRTAALMESVLEEDRPALAAIMAKQSTGQPTQVEYRIRRPDGQVRWIWARSFPVHDEHGQLYRTTGISEDVTQRKLAQEQAIRHQAELAHVSRLNTMGEMASGLAHELNQPLAAITNYARGCIRRLQIGAAATDQHLAALEQIADQADRAGKIISRMREFVRKREPQRSPVRINDVVTDASRLLEADAREHSITVQLDLAPNLPPVFADAIQIEQVLINLMRNAMDAVAEVPPDRRRVIVATAADKSGAVRVAVTDRGTGLSNQVAQRLFEPFFTTKNAGLGMGLSISRSIVESHGGRLWGEPGAQCGALFQFTLPASAKSEP